MLAVVEVVVSGGPETIAVLGGVVSAGGRGVAACTVQLLVAGEVSALPAASVAFTEKTWEPATRPLYALGEMQTLHDPESREHWKVEPLSLEVKAKLALVSVVVSEGPELIVVVGAVVSAGGGGGDVGVGGPAGRLARLRGLVPAAISAPSPNPSRSLSNFLGSVLVLCSSTQLLSPSLSGSIWLVWFEVVFWLEVVF